MYIKLYKYKFLKRNIVNSKKRLNSIISIMLNIKMFIASLSLLGNKIANSKLSVASVFNNTTVEENKVKIPKASSEKSLVNIGIEEKTIILKF